MSTKALPPSPQTTLAIVLGASKWPNSPEFHASAAFSNAAANFKAYLLDPQKFGLPTENLLDLFDTTESYGEIDEGISHFLEKRTTELRDAGNPTRDVLLYFIGHGGFVGRDDEFYLAIQRTRSASLRASAIPMVALADTLINNARHLRRLIILDCCFADAAFRSFQGGPDQVAIKRSVEAFEMREQGHGFPGKGTALLCSSDHKSPSLLLPDESSTMFSKALFEMLTYGNSYRDELLSLRDLKTLTDDWLHDQPNRNAPKPTIHSPDQSEGDVGDVPFFPNPAKMHKEELDIKTSSLLHSEKLSTFFNMMPVEMKLSKNSVRAEEKVTTTATNETISIPEQEYTISKVDAIPTSKENRPLYCSLGHLNPLGSFFCDECGELFDSTPLKHKDEQIILSNSGSVVEDPFIYMEGDPLPLPSSTYSTGLQSEQNVEENKDVENLPSKTETKEPLASPIAKTSTKVPFLGSFELPGTHLIQQNKLGAIRIDTTHLRKLDNRQIILLNDISLSIPAQSMVALVGDMEASKALLNALNAVQPAQSGDVFYSGMNFYRNLASFSGQIGYVTKSEFPHKNWTVEHALNDAAKKQLPKNIIKSAMDKRIAETLDEMEMWPYRGLQLHKLSGGQRKRVAIAIELLTDPVVLFLDEPTSGLNPGADRTMKLLLRGIADKGRTVILTTDASDSINICDFVCFLARGRLAYYGPTGEVKAYFGTSDFAEVYNILEPTSDHPNIAEEAEVRFRASFIYDKYVNRPLLQLRVR